MAKSKIELGEQPELQEQDEEEEGLDPEPGMDDDQDLQQPPQAKNGTGAQPKTSGEDDDDSETDPPEGADDQWRKKMESELKQTNRKLDKVLEAVKPARKGRGRSLKIG